MTRRELIPRIAMLLMPLPSAAAAPEKTKQDWDRLAIAVKCGALTIDEARALFGLGPVPLAQVL